MSDEQWVGVGEGVSIEETHDHGLGFLAKGEDLFQFGLGLGQGGFAGLLSFAVLNEFGFDLVGAGLGFNGLLECLQFRIIGGEGISVGPILAIGGGTTGGPGATTAPAEGAGGPAHGAGAEVATGFGDLGESGFDEFPFGVVLDAELIAETFHHALAHLFGIPVAAFALAWAFAAIAIGLALALGEGGGGEEDGGEAGHGEETQDG